MLNGGDGFGMRKLVSAGLLASLLLVGGCDWMRAKPGAEAKSKEQLAEEKRAGLRKACASEATYERLKELVFDQATRIRNSDARVLDPVAAGSVVRMEEPLVKGRDEDLNVTVCTGKFILELPPGAENAFDGMRRVSADVEYSAQAAADGSGLVYQMDGAEPIVYRLATLGLSGQPLPQVVEVPQPSAPPSAPPEVAVVAPESRAAAPQAAPPVRIAPAPETRPEPAAPQRSAGDTRPSFNCRYARSSTEKAICGSPGLAAKDRQMASIYYAAMANSDAATKAHLRRSRDGFLQRRERCGSEACIVAAYNARISEIRSIADGR